MQLTRRLYVEPTSRSRLYAYEANFWEYLHNLQAASKRDWWTRLVAGTDIPSTEKEGFTTLATEAKLVRSARVLLSRLFNAHLGTYYGGLDYWFNRQISQADLPFAGVNVNTNKDMAIDMLCTWAMQQQRALWAQHLSAMRSSATRLSAEVNEGDGWRTGGVHCSVYVKTAAGMQRVGNDYLATARDAGDQHAEMKWKAAHATAFSAKLNGQPNPAVKVEFHISKVPCDEWCSEQMITWWASLTLPRGFTGAYIYTYQDEQAGSHVYELRSDAILHLGTWA